MHVPSQTAGGRTPSGSRRVHPYLAELRTNSASRTPRMSVARAAPWLALLSLGLLCLTMWHTAAPAAAFYRCETWAFGGEGQ